MAYQVKKLPQDVLAKGQRGGALLEDEGAPSTGTAPGIASKPVSTGGSGRFINFQRMLNANADVSAREGSKVADRVEQAGAAAQNAVKGYEAAGVAGTPSAIQNVRAGATPPKPGANSYGDANAKVQAANAQVNAARGGVTNQAALMGNVSPLDGALMRSPVGGRLHAAGQKYAGLSGMLSTAQTNVRDAKAQRDALANVGGTDGELGAPRGNALDGPPANEDDKMLDQLLKQGAIGPSHIMAMNDPTASAAARAQFDQRYGAGAWDRMVAAYRRRTGS